jgi:hypothetical protein
MFLRRCPLCTDRGPYRKSPLVPKLLIGLLGICVGC